MATKTPGRYIEAIGRRKTATARVRLTPADKTTIMVNDKELTAYFPHLALHKDVMSVLEIQDAGIENYTITAKVLGGGISSQAEAIRLGIARALVKEKADRRTELKKAGFLKRDPRSVERKKFGLLKARKSPAWSKR
ncbi:30S ribosomal protein S9 [Candidatus Saccharibacteria bacterium]|nr:30S ribosomal protein S9 [Candidatus Saccharibacteria bacterium]